MTADAVDPVEAAWAEYTDWQGGTNDEHSAFIAGYRAALAAMPAPDPRVVDDFTVSKHQRWAEEMRDFIRGHASNDGEIYVMVERLNQMLTPTQPRVPVSREQIAMLIDEGAFDFPAECEGEIERAYQAADAILALLNYQPTSSSSQTGSSTPTRTVESVEELEALPGDTVIKSNAGYLYQVEHDSDETWLNDGPTAYAVEDMEPGDLFPATILTLTPSPTPSVTVEDIIWDEYTPNDGTYEHTLAADCDGTILAYWKREPAAVIVDGLWTHRREPGPWQESTEAEYMAANIPVADASDSGGGA